MELVLGSFAIFFMILIGFAMYRARYYKSTLGAEFGANIKTQVGESTAKAYHLHPATLRVYQVTRPQTATDLMGVEVRIPTATELQRVSLTFTVAEARDLVALIQRAIALPAEVSDSSPSTDAKRAAAEQNH